MCLPIYIFFPDELGKKFPELIGASDLSAFILFNSSTDVEEGKNSFFFS